jgi:hypothetical protein
VASVNLCGQCHNARGAQVTDTSRPPHHSPQYNLLLGNIGVSGSGAPPQASHQELLAQCAHCHAHQREVANPTPQNPVGKGHSFAVDYEACVVCHGDAEYAAFLAEETRSFVTDRMEAVRRLLNTWGTTKAPAALRTNYGALAWEYNNPGALSNPTGSSSLRGPTTAQQTNVPLAIKEARFNLYIVAHDGSYGAHNPSYVFHLLRAAESKVREELNK